MAKTAAAEVYHALVGEKAYGGPENALPVSSGGPNRQIGKPTNDLLNLVHTKGVQVDFHEAKTRLSRLLDRVALGEEVVITRAGKPVARLISVERSRRDRVLGRGEGDFEVPDDFNDPLPEEILDTFERD